LYVTAEAGLASSSRGRPRRPMYRNMVIAPFAVPRASR
jgi:hypothetical protein